MRVWDAVAARDILWQYFNDNHTADDQPLRIAELTGNQWDDLWRFQIRFPGYVYIVDVGPRGGIRWKVKLELADIAELR